jgi:hypothetical protein
MENQVDYQNKKVDNAEYAYSQIEDQQSQIKVLHMYELRKLNMCKAVMTNERYLQNTKLFMCYLFMTDAEQFKASHVYNALGFKKAHWLRFVKPQLVEMKWIRPINKTHYEFLNPLFLDIF